MPGQLHILRNPFRDAGLSDADREEEEEHGVREGDQQIRYTQVI
jgi:hypothetical protein